MFKKILSLAIAIMFLGQNALAGCQINDNNTLASQSWLQDADFRDSVQVSALHSISSRELSLPKRKTATSGKSSGREIEKGGAIGKGSCLRDKDNVTTYRLWEDYRNNVAKAIERLKDRIAKCEDLEPAEREKANQVVTEVEKYYSRGDIVWFRSLVKREDDSLEKAEDYLIAFLDTRYDSELKSRRDQIALAKDFFHVNNEYSLLEHLDEVLFHEGSAVVFGESDYQAHQRIYGKVDPAAGIDYSGDSLQRKIFGKENYFGSRLREYVDYIADNKDSYDVTFASNIKFKRNPQDNRNIANNLDKIVKCLKDKRFVYESLGLGGVLDLSVPIREIRVSEGGTGSQKQTLRVDVFFKDGLDEAQSFALKVAINRAAKVGFAKSERKEIPTMRKISRKDNCKVPRFGCYLEDLSDSDNKFYVYTEAWIEGPTADQLKGPGQLTPTRIENIVVAYLSVMCALDTKKGEFDGYKQSCLRIADEAEEKDVDIRYLAVKDVQPQNVMFKAWLPDPKTKQTSSRSEEAECVDIGKIEYIRPLKILRELNNHYGITKERRKKKRAGTEESEEEKQKRRKQIHKAIFDGVVSRGSLGEKAGRRFLEETLDKAGRDREKLNDDERLEANLLTQSLKEYLHSLYIQERAEEVGDVLHKLCFCVLRDLAEYKQNPEDASILYSISGFIAEKKNDIYDLVKKRGEEESDLKDSDVLRKEMAGVFTNKIDSVSGNDLKLLLDKLSSSIRGAQDTNSVLDVLEDIYHVSFLLERVAGGRIAIVEHADGNSRIDLLSRSPREIVTKAWKSHSYVAAEVLGPLSLNRDDVHLSLGGGPGTMNIAACLSGVRESIYIDIAKENLPLIKGLEDNYGWIAANENLKKQLMMQPGLNVEAFLKSIEEVKEISTDQQQPIEVSPDLVIIGGDAAEELTKLEDDSVSKVNILDFLHHLENQGGRSKELKVLRNVLRVVSPGGLILIKPNTRGGLSFFKRFLVDIAVLMDIELEVNEVDVGAGALLFRVGAKKSISGKTPGPNLDSAPGSAAPQDFDLDLDLPDELRAKDMLDFYIRSSIVATDGEKHSARYYVATQGEVKEEVDQLWGTIGGDNKEFKESAAVAIEVNRFIDLNSIEREGDVIRFKQNGVGLRQVLKRVGENGFIVLYGCEKKKMDIEEMLKASMPDVAERIILVEDEVTAENIVEIRDAVAEDQYIASGNIVFSVSESIAGNVAKLHKEEIRGNSLKIVSLNQNSPLHTELLVNFLYASVEIVFTGEALSEEMLGYLTLLPLLGYSEEDIQRLKEELPKLLYFRIEIIDMEKIFREAWLREMYINVSV